MSWLNYHLYGFGVKISDLKSVSIVRVIALAQTAPEYAKRLNSWLDENGITNPTFEDLEDFDEGFRFGLATLLSEVIEEREGIYLMSCDDFDGNIYLLFRETYPWRLKKKERFLKEGDVKSLIVKYLSQITDEEITIDYYGPENGG